MLHEEMVAQRARPVFTGNDKAAEVVNLKQECKDSKHVTRNVEMQMADMKRSMRKAETQVVESKAFELKINSLSTLCREQEWALRDSDEQMQKLAADIKDESSRNQALMNRSNEPSLQAAAEIARQESSIENLEAQKCIKCYGNRQTTSRGC